MLKKAIIACALGAAAFGAAAQAQTANLTLTGIITPGPCNLNLTGNTITYGTVATTVVQAYNGVAYKELPPRTIVLSLICPSASKIAIDFTDNFAAARPTIGALDTVSFGLTDTNVPNSQLGAYTLNVSGLTHSASLTPLPGKLWAPSGTATFSAHPLPGSSQYAVPAYAMAPITTVGNTAPDAILQMNGNIVMNALVSDTALASGNAIRMSGGTTLTIKYL